MPCDDNDGNGGYDGRRRKGVLVVVMMPMMLLAEVVMATVVAMAVPTLEVREVTVMMVVMVVMATARATDLAKLFAEAIVHLCRSRESACCLFPTHSMPSGANSWLLLSIE